MDENSREFQAHHFLRCSFTVHCCGRIIRKGVSFLPRSLYAYTFKCVNFDCRANYITLHYLARNEEEKFMAYCCSNRGGLCTHRLFEATECWLQPHIVTTRATTLQILLINPRTFIARVTRRGYLSILIAN